MNADILTDTWKQNKGKVKKHWRKFTDDDLVMIEGQPDKLIELVQERYGYTHEQAEGEVDQFLQKVLWEFKDSVVEAVGSSN